MMTKKHVVRVYNKGITATYMVYDKRLFTEYEFVTKIEAMQFIRRLELANDKRATEYFLREVDE
ncbi:phage protein [Streptococcus dysgalactiae subsp. equisimilis]|nr:phage protein [Streptococcus dysgalactiae subsp. equisimilis]SQF78128.1 phage protein [Streptococcus dysgalactiae subsp. equisimilis]